MTNPTPAPDPQPAQDPKQLHEPQQPAHGRQGGWVSPPPLPQVPAGPGVPSRRRQRIKLGATAAVALFVGVGIGPAAAAGRRPATPRTRRPCPAPR